MGDERIVFKLIMLGGQGINIFTKELENRACCSGISKETFQTNIMSPWEFSLQLKT